jgi:hypothetical protein
LKTKTLIIHKIKLENMNSNESQNPQLNIAAVSSRFSLLMLTSRLLTLELQLKEANLTMGQNPNQYTDNEIEMLKPMIEDLRKAVAVLQNGY